MTKRQLSLVALISAIAVAVIRQRRHRPSTMPETRPWTNPPTTSPTTADVPPIGFEAPEADALEQSRTVIPDDVDDDPAPIPFEASEADVLDQRRTVALDDELRADDEDED